MLSAQSRSRAWDSGGPCHQSHSSSCREDLKYCTHFWLWRYTWMYYITIPLFSSPTPRRSHLWSQAVASMCRVTWSRSQTSLTLVDNTSICVSLLLIWNYISLFAGVGVLLEVRRPLWGVGSLLPLLFQGLNSGWQALWQVLLPPEPSPPPDPYAFYV